MKHHPVLISSFGLFNFDHPNLKIHISAFKPSGLTGSHTRAVKEAKKYGKFETVKHGLKTAAVQ